jgi:hypothetical protein
MDVRQKRGKARRAAARDAHAGAAGAVTNSALRAMLEPIVVKWRGQEGNLIISCMRCRRRPYVPRAAPGVVADAGCALARIMK